MAGKIIAEIWLDLVPRNGGPGSGPGNGADDGGASNTTSQGLNDGVIIDQEGGGITFLGAGSIKGGKTDYDVGQGFWLGFDTSDQYYKVAIGDPNGDTFNWDGEEINSKMNNLELRGWLRGPAEFVIDPAAHGDETGEVVIAGDMEIQGSTLQVPNDFTIDPATHGDDTGNLIIAGNLEVAGGTITGPATIVIDPAAVGATSGLVQILGDLQVDGLTTTINSSVMTVDDKNVVIGEGATNAAAVNLGGFTLEGANATILYTASDDKWNLNKGLNITGDLEATGDITAGGALEGQSLDIGSGSLTVNSGGDLVTQGSLTVAGVSSLDGHVELGDSSTDLITFNGLVNSHIIPQTHNLYDLGSTNLRWRTLYVEDIFADTIDVGDGDFAVDTDGNVDANSIDLGFAAIDENGNATFATLTLGSATQGYILKQVNAPTSALSFVNHTTMELNNVASTAPTNATVLKYNSTNSQYESVDFKTTSLEDVSTTTATDNQILKYNLANTQYEPVDHNTRQLEDVSNTAPTNDQILQYNSATSKYEPEDFILDTLTDVTIADLADGDLLVYQSATSDWRNKTKTGAGFHDIAMSGDWSDLENTPTSLAGYGITDAYTKAQVYTKTEVDGLLYTDGDVDAHLNRSTAGTDEILSWNGTDYEWVTYSEIVGSVEELTDLSDVFLSNPIVRLPNDVLMWNGTYWTDQQMTWSVLSGKPSTVAGFNITDFDTRIDSHLNQGNASTDQLLSWNGTDYEWVDGGSNTNLADLTDVTGTPSTGSILVWDATGSLKWEAATLNYFSLSELGNVATTSPSTNQVLLWNGSAWAPGTISGNSTSLSLNNLTDVSLGTLNTNDYLKWDGSAWVDSVIDWTHIANKPTILTTADLYTDSDVDAHLNKSSAATNQVLTWNGTDYSWTTPGTSNVSVLNDLSDVAAGAPSSGQLLQYNGTNWVAYTLSVSFSSLTNKPTTIAGYGITDAFDGAFSSLTGVPGFAEDLGDLGDVTLSTLVDGHILKYNSTTQKWQNVLNNLNALSDVSISGPSANQVLSYNSTTQKWQNGAFNIGSLANVNSNADSPSNTSNSTVGASPAVLWYNSGNSEWNASPLELDDLYGIPDPAAGSANVGYVLAIKTLTHPQEYEWVSPNTSTSSLVPATTNTYDIGSSTKVWRDLHLGRYIELGNITISNNSGTLEVDGSALATQTYVGTEVSTAITNLIDSAPAALDTLNELAAALGDDPNFATTVSTSLGNKLNISDFSSTADAWIVNKTTDDLGEGSTNLYHSTERVQDVVGGQFVANGTHTGISFTYDDATDGAIDATVSLSAFNSDNLTEGSTNLYFTEARARAALSVTTATASGGGSLSYANTTGVFTYTPPDLSSTLTTSSSIADLSDVDSLVTSGASNKDVLWYNTTSGEWENTAPANIASAISLSNLSDVSSTAATGGQVLTWNGTNSEWEAVTPYGSSNFNTDFASKSIKDLSDVFNYTAVNNGDLLKWNSAASLWSPGTLDTDVVSEGSTNLYYTDARVQTKLGAVSGSIIPNANETYDLGSSTYKFRDLYLSGNTLTLGTLSISDSSGALNVTSGGSPAKFSSVGITDNATSTAITINSSENVLVGGSSDRGRKFVVEGTGDLAVLYSTNDGAGGAQLDLIQDSSSKAADDAVGIINFSSDLRQYSSIRGIAHDHTNGYGQLRFGVRQNTSTYNHNAMIIDSTGYVGIGELSPETNLHITSATKNSTVLKLENYLSTTNGSSYDSYQELKFVAASADQNAAGIRHHANVWATGHSALSFWTSEHGGSYAERMRIDGPGNVIIKPSARLYLESSSGFSPNFLEASNGLTINTNNAERMRIDSLGNVGFAGAAQSFGSGVMTLQLKGLSSGQPTRAGALRFISNNGTSCDTAIYSDNGFMSFYTGTSTSQNLNLQIDAYGGLNIKSVGGTQAATFGGSNLVNGITALPSSAGTPFVVGRDTGSLKSATFAGHVNINTGYGLSFDSGANYLDDYEEGTWTPTITNHGGSTTGQTVAGVYTKVGNICHFQGVLTQGSGSTTGFVSLGGFPFTAAGTYGHISINTSSSSMIQMSSARVISGYNAFVIKDYDGDSVPSGVSGPVNICFQGSFQVA